MDKCHTCGGIVETPMCTKCYTNNIAITELQVEDEVRKKVIEEAIALFPHDNLRWVRERIKSLQKSQDE